MQKIFNMPYGRSSLSFKIPYGHVTNILQTNPLTPIKDSEVVEHVLAAIEKPIGCPQLKELVRPENSVAFICNDLTRVANSFAFMPALLDSFNKLGVPDEKMKIVFSLGAHRDMTHREMVESVGAEAASRVRMFNSQACKAEDFLYQGTTSRGTPVFIHREICNTDIVVLTGTVVQHYFAGYGGGRKAVLPGCSSLETITANHKHMMDERCGLGITQGNPCYEDQIEGVKLFAKNRRLFLFNAVLNAKHQFLKMFAGDWIKAHLEACKFVDEVYGCPIKEKADLVIASCGGYPKDINIYQMQKTMDNARCAVKEGGAVVIFAECEEGAGNELLVKTYERLKSFAAIENELRQNFRMGANKAFAISRNMQHARYILVTGADKDLCKLMHFTEAYRTPEEALTKVKEFLPEDPSIILMPEASLTVPILQN